MEKRFWRVLCWRWELLKIRLRHIWRLDGITAESLATHEEILEAMYGESPDRQDVMRSVERRRRDAAGVPGYYPMRRSNHTGTDSPGYRTRIF